jgi:cation transport protein ChaC
MSDGPSPADPQPLRVTRDALHDGSLLAAIRASAPPGTRLRDEAELQRSLADTLKGHDPQTDVHVFGYGSLMWNPAFHHAEAMAAKVRGWHRAFRLWIYMARGTPSEPGLMLALDRGGACRGMLFRIDAAHAQAELSLLWRREMLSGAYEARWVRADGPCGPVRALTFVANRKHERYVAHLTGDEIAHYLATGKGSLGTCLAYFESMAATLARMGIRDAAIERVRRAVQRRAAG